MSEPAVPPPDVKDWTWVITRPCPDCGFDPNGVEHAAVPDLTRSYAARMQTALEAPGAGHRPSRQVWSALEYGCHVRDVCRLFADRLRLMLTENDPRFANWDQDETAITGRYWEQRPADVSAQLATDADTIAEAFARVTGDRWQRAGTRSNGDLFTVDTFARYFLHDLAHHCWDVEG